MPIRKPNTIANDPFKSAKWDEITEGRTFTTSHIPTLTLLIQWYVVVERCIEDIDEANGQVAYQNDMGDLKPLPQISTMKQASAEIRQLNKQLGITDAVEPAKHARNTKKASVLELAQSGRAARAKKAM